MCIELSAPKLRAAVAGSTAKQPQLKKKKRRVARKKLRAAARAEKMRRRKERKPQRKRAVASVAAAPVVKAKLPRFAGDADGLVRAFEDGTLAREHWTHAAHLIVALAYAHGHRAEAYTRLRDGIRAYNAASGFVETPTRGYHETITRAWFHLVLHFLDVFDEGQPLQALADDLIEVYTKDELWVHYSRERLLSGGARAGWVEPDRQALPQLEPFTPQDRRWLATLGPQAAVSAPAAAAPQQLQVA